MSFGVSTYSGQASVKLDPLKCRDGSRPSVLLAEDSPAARVLTGALLNRIGCDVDAAEHGEEALAFIKNSDYDLVLMDIEMPVMDGVAAAQEIRTMGGTAAKTPIVALSAFLADTKKSAFWQKHFDIALAKPADKQQLHATISQVLNLKSLNENNLSGDAAEEHLIVDEEKLARILSNVCYADKVMLLQTASMEIRNNSSELMVNQQRVNMDGVDCALHKLCGLSATFAATCLYKLVAKLRADLKNDAVFDLQKQAYEVCKCADRTAKILLEKAGALPENEI